jgi:phosphoribosylformylglycinamidine (FGAM) synthase-like amidotransferase family enzyme
LPSAAVNLEEADVQYALTPKVMATTGLNVASGFQDGDQRHSNSAAAPIVIQSTVELRTTAQRSVLGINNGLPQEL